MFDIILNINNKCINNIVFWNMKKFIIVLFTLYSFNIYSQVEIGVAVANDIENDISKLGLGTSYKIFPKVSLGLGVMITPFDIDDDYEIMYNVKYNLGRFNFVGGFMKEMNPKMDSEPYFGVDFKLFKNRKLKVFYNQSEMMKTIGIKTPIF
tara:strand:- start:3428 stop:3883 length:456 start_codon:yes stop_codon:yes gene_type:complete